jgi:hypothetical protein
VTVGGVTIDHLECHTAAPKRLATLVTHGPDASGSSLHSEGGSVTVQQLNQQDASRNCDLPGSPSNSPKRPDFGPAPTDARAQSEGTPKRPQRGAAPGASGQR